MKIVCKTLVLVGLIIAIVFAFNRDLTITASDEGVLKSTASEEKTTVLEDIKTLEKESAELKNIKALETSAEEANSGNEVSLEDLKDLDTERESKTAFTSDNDEKTQKSKTNVKNNAETQKETKESKKEVKKESEESAETKNSKQEISEVKENSAENLVENSETAEKESEKSSQEAIELNSKPAINESVNAIPDEEIKEELKPTEPSVLFETVDEDLYVSASSLNVRSGPGSSYQKMGILSRNNKVRRIGIGDNGWSKIEYKNQECYVSSKYLIKEKIKTSSGYDSVLDEMNSRSGMIGRLTIPSVGVDVALFEVSIYDGEANQAIVDRKDSAVYMPDAVGFFGQIVLGDHRHQGFSAIKKSVAGDTYAYIDFGTYTKSYICVDRFKGYNQGDLVDMNGVSISGRNDGGICMYTCNTDDTITITFWQPV